MNMRRTEHLTSLVNDLKNAHSTLLEQQYHYTRGVISGFFMCGDLSEKVFEDELSNLRIVRNERHAQLDLTRVSPAHSRAQQATELHP